MPALQRAKGKQSEDAGGPPALERPPSVGGDNSVLQELLATRNPNRESRDSNGGAVNIWANGVGADTGNRPVMFHDSPRSTSGREKRPRVIGPKSQTGSESVEALVGAEGQSLLTMVPSAVSAGQAVQNHKIEKAVESRGETLPPFSLPNTEAGQVGWALNTAVNNGMSTMGIVGAGAGFLNAEGGDKVKAGIQLGGAVSGGVATAATTASEVASGMGKAKIATKAGEVAGNATTAAGVLGGVGAGIAAVQQGQRARSAWKKRDATKQWLEDGRNAPRMSDFFFNPTEEDVEESRERDRVDESLDGIGHYLLGKNKTEMVRGGVKATGNALAALGPLNPGVAAASVAVNGTASLQEAGKKMYKAHETQKNIKAVNGDAPSIVNFGALSEAAVGAADRESTGQDAIGVLENRAKMDKLKERHHRAAQLLALYEHPQAHERAVSLLQAQGVGEEFLQKLDAGRQGNGRLCDNRDIVRELAAKFKTN